MNAPTTKSEKPNVEMLSCQYLWGSTECLLQGIGDYNNPKMGSIERSFTEIHRAWNALWIADAKSSNTNWSIVDPKNPNYTRGIENYVIQAKDNKGLLIEKYFNEKNLTEEFQKMRNFNGPLRGNFNIIYKLRNIMEHDFVEFSGDMYGDAVLFLNPYVNANMLNYLRIYKKVYEKVTRDCSDNHTTTDKRNGRCANQKLLKTLEIISGISLPAPMKENTEYRKIYSNFTFRKIRSRRKTLGNYLKSIIEECTIQISTRGKTSPEFKQKISVNTEDENSYEPDDLEAKAKYMIDSYKYGTLSDIARSMLNTTLGTTPSKKQIESLRFKCQKIKEKLVEELKNDYGKDWEEEAKIYWRSFWGKSVRYSDEFYNLINEQINLKSLT